MKNKALYMIALFCMCFHVIGFGQRIVTYYINDKDTSLHGKTEYTFDELLFSDTNKKLCAVMKRLSLNENSEMYVLVLGYCGKNVTIRIQNWEYRGISNIKDKMVYGMFRSGNMKDFLVCYDDVRVVKHARTLFHRTSNSINISIRMKNVPNGQYVLLDDLTTLYEGVFINKRLKTQKIVLNNKVVGDVDLLLF